MKHDMGLIHIYCGDGKGKTTACVGLALRCAGGGGNVLFYQFLKDGSSGELSGLKQMDNIDVMEGYLKSKFSFLMNDKEIAEAKAYYTDKFKEIYQKAGSGKYQLLVLDEALHAVNLGYISLESMLDFLKEKPEHLEVVLTGRNPKEALCEVADYITEMKKVKHPFDKGIGARHLIED